MADDDANARALRFSTFTANLGSYPLQLQGGPPKLTAEAIPTASDANECVRWNGRICTATTRVGTFDIHWSHRHWHLGDFARYELRKLDEDGYPDLSAEGLIVDGGKTSFCLRDSLSTRSAPSVLKDPFAITGFLPYEVCSGVVQGISPGWMDWYDPSLPGQQLLLEGVEDGHYALVVTIDPHGALAETSHDDNAAWVEIELTGGGSFVSVL